MIEKIINDQPKTSDKKWLVVFVVVSIVTIISSITFSITSQKIIPAQENTWKTATPGHEFSTIIQEKLGTPLEIKNTALGREYHYSSDFPTYPSTVLVSDSNEILFIKERLSYNPEYNVQTYIENFGEPELILNYPRISYSVKANVFLNKGIVIFAHIADGSVEAIWYFEPTNKEKFLESWGKELTIEEKGPEVF
jgi:hypothetical protein